MDGGSIDPAWGRKRTLYKEPELHPRSIDNGLAGRALNKRNRAVLFIFFFTICFPDDEILLQESICAAWPKWAPWRAPLLPATVNRWPATEAPTAGKGFTAAGHLTCPPHEIVIYRGGLFKMPAAVKS